MVKEGKHKVSKVYSDLTPKLGVTTTWFPEGSAGILNLSQIILFDPRIVLRFSYSVRDRAAD